MSACADIRPLLLEAEPEELRGRGGSPVAEHVRSCPACGRVAERILDDMMALDAYLTAMPSPEAVRAVLHAAGVDAPPAGEAKPATRPPRAFWLPLAAAAAVAAVLLVGRGGPPPSAESVARLAAAPPPVVRPEPGQNVAVIQTDNPDITVLWLF